MLIKFYHWFGELKNDKIGAFKFNVMNTVFVYYFFPIFLRYHLEKCLDGGFTANQQHILEDTVDVCLKSFHVFE